jgi:tyrosine-protein kinase Etk/Wzc
MVRFPFRSRKPPPVTDDLGGTTDGRVVVVDASDGVRVHVTPARVASSLRFLLARLQRSNAPLPSRLAVTSALRGEGVTFITRSLASVLAYDTTDSVVIVDLNWQEEVDDEVDDEESQGRPTLIDAVEERASVDEVIRATTNPRLHFIVAGGLAPHRRPAVASSPELAKVIDEVASRFDLVLLDLPPAMASSDAITLSHLADAFLLVIHFGVTTDAQVEATLHELRGTNRLGIVVNRFDSSVPASVRRVLGT